MPRPRIGKVPHWDTISPSEAKELRKLEERKKKFAVMQVMDWYLDHIESEPYQKAVIYVVEESPSLIYRGKKLVSGVTMREAQMWANMMK